MSRKVALVTGASRGIGREIAVLLSNNYDIIINYSGSEDKALETKALCDINNSNNIIYKCNVSDFEETKKMIDFIIEKYNKIDLVVNNAGITKDTLLLRMNESDFDDVININLKGVFNICKHASKYMMKQRNGKIINITSVVGITGNIGQANYASSKAGVIGLTKSLAKELAPRGILVNAIAPGYIITDMTEKLDDNIKNMVLEHIPLKKLGDAKDIAYMVEFLSSDKANYITGQIIKVDGGMVI